MSKIILPIALLVMLVSYQNCSDGFNPAVLEQSSSGSTSNGSGGDDDETITPPPVYFDYTRLRMDLDKSETEQLQSIVSSVDHLEEDLNINFYGTCYGEQEQKLSLSGNCNSGVSCVEFSCDNAGTAYIRSTVISRETGQELNIGSSILNFLQKDKVQVPGSISLLGLSEVGVNTEFTFNANFSSQYFPGEGEFVVDWGISSACEILSQSNSQARFVCSSAGVVNVQISASNRDYTSSASTKIMVGQKDQEFDIIVPIIRAHNGEYPVSVSDLAVSVDKINWQLDSSKCKLKNASTTGLQNTVECSGVPSNAQLNLTASISDSFYKGSKTRSIEVKKASLSVNIKGLASLTTGKNQNLTVEIKKNGAVSSISGFNLNWSVCGGSGESARTIEKSNTASLTDGTACSSAGSKTFSVSVSNSDWEGSDSDSTNIVAPTYRYYWDESPYYNYNLSNTCSSLQLPSCGAGSFDNSVTCCELLVRGEIRKLETTRAIAGLHCEEAKKYVCKREQTN